MSDIRGTTTDPVSKAMELLPLGPVTIIDTPGFDDEGTLGAERVRRTKQVLNRTDVAVLVVDAAAGNTDCDRELIGIFKEKDIPYLVAYNKADLQPADQDGPDGRGRRDGRPRDRGEDHGRDDGHHPQAAGPMPDERF